MPSEKVGDIDIHISLSQEQMEKFKEHINVKSYFVMNWNYTIVDCKAIKTQTIVKKSNTLFIQKTMSRSLLTLAMNLHNFTAFTAFHRKILYEICGEKKQLFTAYLTYFSDFFNMRVNMRFGCFRELFETFTYP